MGKNPRISITLSKEDYEVIKKNCDYKGIDISAYGREVICNDIHGEITKENINLISTIIREQLDIVLDLKLERLFKLLSVTCVQSGAAAYLAAEALATFVPAKSQQDFNTAYTKARLKSVAYVKNFSDDDIDEK